MASATRAMNTLTSPITGFSSSPRSWLPTTRMAKLGRARPTLETLMISSPKRRLWPSHSEMGTAMTMAAITATNEIWTCSRMRTVMPSLPR